MATGRAKSAPKGKGGPVIERGRLERVGEMGGLDVATWGKGAKPLE
jgi:hypothetical protein